MLIMFDYFPNYNDVRARCAGSMRALSLVLLFSLTSCSLAEDWLVKTPGIKGGANHPHFMGFHGNLLYNSI